jgi:hypothetical protein
MDLSGPGIDVKLKERKKESYKVMIFEGCWFLLKLFNFEDYIFAW